MFTFCKLYHIYLFQLIDYPSYVFLFWGEFSPKNPSFSRRTFNTLPLLANLDGTDFTVAAIHYEQLAEIKDFEHYINYYSARFF